jgi:pyroglutamyl-peptidase
MTILITGFGPFDGGSNASDALLGAIARERPRLEATLGIAIATRLLPVDTLEAPSILAQAIDALAPSHILLMGQAASRTAISLEAVARNRRHFRVPDSAGRLIENAQVLDDGPESYAATWPDLPGLAAELSRARIPAVVSEECGGHLCNQVLYTTLHGAAASARPCAAMFLHLPLLPEQVAAGEPAALRNPDCSGLPLATMVAAVEIVLAHTLALEHAA